MTAAAVGVRAPRVAVLVKRFPRLSETFILNEFLELRRQGVPVDLYAIMDPGERQSQPEALALLDEVNYLQPKTLWHELPAIARTARRHPLGVLRTTGWMLTRHTRAALRNFLHALVLLDRLAHRGPAHLHAHFLHAPAAIAFIAHKVNGQPYSLTGHAKDIYTTLPENLQMRCRDARFITSCTQANVRYLTDHLHLPPDRVHLVRHGVEIARFAVSRQPRNSGRILSVGRLVPKKGFDILIRACAELHRRDVAFELRIVGGGELRLTLAELAHELGISDKVHLAGSRPQPAIIDELAHADVFALSPRVLADGDRDGIPNVLLEAMAAGLPVVASAVSGIPEVVHDQINGRLAPAADPVAFANVLDDLLRDASQRIRLGVAAQQYVRENCGWEQAVMPLRDLLTQELRQDAATQAAMPIGQ